MALNPIGWITGGVIEGVGKVATDVGRTFFGDKTEKEKHVSDEQIAVLNQYAAEYAARQQRTWWDSFIDGLNRLVRPLLALGAQAAFVWVYIDPVGFSECMKAMQLIPDMMWYIWLTIFGFFFGGRIIENAPKTWNMDARSAEIAKEIVAERTERTRAEAAEKAAIAAAAAVEAAKAAAETAAVAADKNIAVAEKRIEVEKERQVTADKKNGKPVDPPAPAEIEGDNSSEDIRAVAATLWGEARNESRLGKIAVAWVIKNRVAQPSWWGEDWIGVCTARNQFSCWFDKQAPKVRSVSAADTKYIECLEIAQAVMGGETPDPTGGADHYYANYIDTPKWARGKEPTAEIGVHRFYKLGAVG